MNRWRKSGLAGLCLLVVGCACVCPSSDGKVRRRRSLQGVQELQILQSLHPEEGRQVRDLQEEEPVKLQSHSHRADALC